MNTSKKILLFIVIACTAMITGCEKTEDDSDISTAARDKFLGVWAGQSSGSQGTRNFNTTITASNSAPDQILMEDFDLSGAGTYVRAVISGSSLTIITTSISGETYDGTGTLSSNGQTLTINFTVDDGQTIDNRTAIAQKQ